MHQILQNIVRRSSTPRAVGSIASGGSETLARKRQQSNTTLKRKQAEPILKSENLTKILKNVSMPQTKKPSFNLLMQIMNSDKTANFSSKLPLDLRDFKNLLFLSNHDVPYIKVKSGFDLSGYIPNQQNVQLARDSQSTSDGDSFNEAAGASFESSHGSVGPQAAYNYQNDFDASFCPEPEPANQNNVNDNDNENAPNENNDTFDAFYNFKVSEFKKLNVNIRRVKSSMLKCLKSVFADNKPKDAPESKQSKLDEVAGENCLKLDDLLKQSKKMLSTSDSENLCFGTSLISLLHLANDNGFILESNAVNKEFSVIEEVWVKKQIS